MSMHVASYYNLDTFLEILSKSLRMDGVIARIVRLPGMCASGLLGDGMDIVVCSSEFWTKEPLDVVAKKLGSNALLVLLDVCASIHRGAHVFKELGSLGFVKTILPIDGGVIVSIKRGYDQNFFKKSVEVYRESFIYGPNPVDYNTAAMIYVTAKFVASRRKGVLVEIGTGRGFSTLWLAQVAKEVGTKVISMDINCERIERARTFLESIGLKNCAELMCVDAKEYRRGLRDVIYVFIDGWKDEYRHYLEALEPYLKPGALILAHNTLSDAHRMASYIDKVYAEPYESITVATDPKGLTISVYTPRNISS